MAALEMTNRDGGFVSSEANGFRSKDVVTVDATAGALVAGTVLGVVAATGDYVQHDTGASTGEEVAAAILYNGVDAVEGDATVVTRDMEVSQADLTYETGADAAAILAANVELAANGIIVRKEG